MLRRYKDATRILGDVCSYMQRGFKVRNEMWHYVIRPFNFLTRAVLSLTRDMLSLIL
jgi:hypothetical protein